MDGGSILPTSTKIMSTFIREKGKFYSFFEYLLLESIKPKKIKWGSNDNTDNNEFIYNNEMKSYYTFFHFQDTNFIVYIRNNKEIGYEVIKAKKNLIDVVNQASSMYFSTERIGINTAARIFSYVFYVILQVVKKLKYKEIYFSGADKKLGLMYDKLVQNKFFIKAVEKEGWFYTGKKEDYHIFKRR